MADTLIRVDGLSKKFCLNLKRSLWYGLQDLGKELAGRRHGGDGQLRPEEFWAVKDISFELARGECLGLIGHNGAGKTTLLRMLNGLIKPDAGRAELRGRVGALIALGAGFNPVLTGRENIYINAAVLGMSKRHVDSKLDEIVDFAEIGPFLDTPVRNYSSGMNVRLGFAVAAILLEPDVLFLDEVLAVGDIGFVVKCLNVVRRLTQSAAVVFVSHNMQYVSSFCTRVIVLEKGRALIDSNDCGEGIDRYLSLAGNQTSSLGTGDALVLDLRIAFDGAVLDGEAPLIHRGVSMTAILHLRVSTEKLRVQTNVYIADESMVPVICVPVQDATGRLLNLDTGEHVLELGMGAVDLNSGKYSFIVALQAAETRETLARVQGLRPFRVFSDRLYWGHVVRPVEARRLQAADGTTPTPSRGVLQSQDEADRFGRS